MADRSKPGGASPLSSADGFSPYIYSPSNVGLVDRHQLQADWDRADEIDAGSLLARLEAGYAKANFLWIALAFLLAVNLPAVIVVVILRLFS